MPENHSHLFAISPIDGRYRRQTEELSDFFSEYALFKYRILVETEYFIALCEIPLPQLSGFGKKNFQRLRNIHKSFSLNDARQIKKLEKVTNHDVKALEYFLKEKFTRLGLAKYKEFIHFGITSQDINNTAVPLLFRDALEQIYLPALDKIISELKKFSREWKTIPMLAHTHGQPASPTRLGKEFFVFVERLEMQKKLFSQIPFSAKFGGAVGNFNAHYVAYPEINWKSFANNLLKKKFGLYRSQYTTQIEHYDNLAAQFDSLRRSNTILIDLCRDLWLYISMNYFRQKIVRGETGSSTMPHKVNPIDFENAEGNLGIANALFEHLAAKLPVSRLQRDLTDSTALRNIGVPLAHSFLSFKSILKGLGKLIVNREAICMDLEENWAVVSEAVQTILRRENYPAPYEALKEFTRTHSLLTKEEFLRFIESLKVEKKVKDELKKITPFNYTGVFT